MLKRVFDIFGCGAPDVDLAIMSPGQTLADVTARVLAGVTTVLREKQPDIALVHGDTTTAMAAAMAAFYERCPIGHVEAGLRSHDLTSPWPEEFNRVAIDAIAELMFAPTQHAANNLASEYNKSGRILVTGNTGIDALLYIDRQLTQDAGFCSDAARRFGFLCESKKLVLVTGHRRESFGGGFERICEGIARIAAHPQVEVLYPVHLNPNVQGPVRQSLSGLANVHLVEPVDYAEMVWLMRRAHIILTDSGGIQEEGPALGKPVLVMRDLTERPEALATGVVRLVGTDPFVIAREVLVLLDDAAAYRERARVVFPYGDGSAAPHIADALLDWRPVCRGA
jgi:UDP-N-acetylglucosamine 2-epimerase